MAALTLEQLLAMRSEDEWRERLLGALQGIGFVTKDSNGGAGSMSVSGVAVAEYSVVVRISTTGELGTGAFVYSLDGGTVFSSPVTIPSDGEYTLSTTGATLVFEEAPSGSDATSFISNDEYSFEMTVPNLPVTAWQAGGTGLTLIELFAQAAAEWDRSRARVDAGGFLLHSEDEWLDLWVENLYDEERRQGTATVGKVLLTAATGAGPHTISIGQLWVANSAGLRFNNSTGGTLTLSGTLELTFRAEAVGSAYNVGNGTLTSMQVTLAGVTCSNPIPSGASSWIVTAGSDRETDDQLRARMQAKWPTLGTGSTDQVYDSWAKAADTAVTRTTVSVRATTNGTDPNLDLLIAGTTGAVDPSVVDAVQDYVDERVPLTVVALVASAATVSQTITATVYCQRGYQASVEIALDSGMDALFQSIPIEGTIYESAITEVFMVPVGVRNVVMTVPSGDVALGTAEVASYTKDWTVVEV